MFVVHADADLLTWDEFLGLPYETRNTDLIDGKMIVNSPNAQHEQIVGNLLFALKLWQRGPHYGRNGWAGRPRSNR